MPTHANFNVGGAIGVGDTSPSTMLDKGTLPTGACHDQGLIVGSDVGWRQLHCARRKSYQVCTIELALMPTYANFNVL
ncbi:hypothetical protein BZG13_14975 [Salinivibrio sp. ML323]|nr:hypothetical protein BZG13_14975 [Salinivibrio sp. ML323]